MKKKIMELISSILTWEFVLKILIKVAVKVFESYQKEFYLDRKQRMFVQGLDAINRTLGAEWAKETDKDVDDELVDGLKESTATLASHHSFQLHTLGSVGNID